MASENPLHPEVPLMACVLEYRAAGLRHRERDRPRSQIRALIRQPPSSVDAAPPRTFAIHRGRGRLHLDDEVDRGFHVARFAEVLGQVDSRGSLLAGVYHNGDGAVPAPAAPTP